MTVHAKPTRSLKAGEPIEYQGRIVNVLETSDAGVFQLRVDKPFMLDHYCPFLSSDERVLSAILTAGSRYRALHENSGMRGHTPTLDDLVDGAAKIHRGVQALTDRELDALEEFNKAHKQLTPKQALECFRVVVCDEYAQSLRTLKAALVRLAKYWGYLSPKGVWN